MDQFNENSLPKGWTLTRFKDLALYIQRGKSPKYTTHSKFPIVNQKCIRWDGINVEFLKYLDPNYSNGWSAERFLCQGDILWNSTGTGTIGRAAIYKGNIENAITDSHVTIIRLPTHLVVPEYVSYFIMSPYVQKNIENMQTGSTDQVELSKTVIEETIIPLPPFSEQKRIVAKIEGLFAEIDKGTRKLLKTLELLKAYRQSLLKSAFEGTLTVEWRTSKGSFLGNGKELLACVQNQKKEKTKLHPENKNSQLSSDGHLPSLPTGWVWTSLGQIMDTNPQNGVYYPQSKYGQGTPILRIDDFQTDWIRPLKNLRLVESSQQDRNLYAIHKEDFIVNRVNSLSHLGKTICAPSNYSGVLFESNMMRFSISNLINKEYLLYYITSHEGRHSLIRNCKHAVNQASINQQDVKALLIPIPSRKEQDQIAHMITQAFAETAKLEKITKEGIKKAQDLRQSILLKAFAGGLIPKNTDEESISFLMERIQIELESQSLSRKKSKQRQKVSI